MIFCDVITPLYCALFQKQLVCGAFDVIEVYFYMTNFSKDLLYHTCHSCK